MSVNGPLDIIWQYRCKICQMANTHPDVFKELHQNVLEVGMSYTRAMNLINDRIEREHLTCPKLNSQNMTVHFSTHITIPDKVQSEIVKAHTGPSLRDINPEVGSYVEELVRRRVGNEVNDYLNIDRLRSMLMEKLDVLDDLVAKEDNNGVKYIDLQSLDSYIALVKEIRACIVDLNKIRHSKQLVSLVIKSLVERNTFEIVRQMVREYDQIRKDMLESGMSTKDADRIHRQLSLRLAEVVALTAKQAVADISRTYKLA